MKLKNVTFKIKKTNIFFYKNSIFYKNSHFRIRTFIKTEV